ncbi:hypothetical protein A3H38_05100 [candidate division WOR-1 bacterium RIFCSPLOWO2_02_FULL_46_20]|uniref:Glycosyltransferase RgtA/B/C/D-like domain-containing protein n=1 Tax=candidate division WOR-1 bacterium RIFCSPLOWO2_02_FULL_46_20 TaxID=1802567 RepID=A0A1F4R6I9_UNCSA|nr:MAG: hypothetical protein A3H38_05100 [candidate division WOR-1 bacterium RIFCSPLOWO2_02_FULL_46_20]
MEDNNLRKLIKIILAVKACIFLVILIGHYLFPFNYYSHLINFNYPSNAAINLGTGFKTWDAQHYIFLAEKGYAPHQMSNAFSPLFPCLIGLGRIFLGGNSLVAGLFLSNLFSFTAIIFFYLFVKKMFDAPAALAASILFLSFPTSFFLGLVYSESLFIMLVMIFFYCLYQNKVWPVLITGWLLPLTRPQGILLLVPVLIRAFPIRPNSQKKIFLAAPVMLLGGFASYLFFMKYYTGDYFSGLAAQQYFVSGYSIGNMAALPAWFVRNFTAALRFHGFTNSLIDRSFFVVFILLLYPIFRKLDKTLFVYALVMALVPVLAGSFMSYTRYLLPVFPIFMVLAVLLKEKYLYLAIPMFVVQILCLLAHSLNFWIARLTNFLGVV